MKIIIFLIAPLALLILNTSCNNSKEKAAPTIATVDNKKIEVLPTNPQKGAIINMQDTVEIKRTVLCFKDSSKTREGMYAKLADIYNKKLHDAIKANKLIITGAPMAWHTMQKAAYFFEAGIPVNKAPAKAGKGMYMKNTGGDSVYVAHFFGPNDLTTEAYDAIKEKAKENHKVTSDAYEIYIDNPFVITTEPLDLYKLQTDIVWPFRNKGQAPAIVKVATPSDKKDGDKKDGDKKDEAKKDVVKKKSEKKKEEKKEE
jgi:effector-binding domain-containing protein